MNLRDTTQDAERIWLDASRRLTPGQRMERAFELTALLHAAALGVLQRQHPEWSETECRRQLRQRQFGQADR
jgi:hypothetical protein